MVDIRDIKIMEILQKNGRSTASDIAKEVGLSIPAVGERIKKHIQLGDIYEMNYCQELFSKGHDINPSSVFWELHLKSNAPFSVFSKMRNKYLLCSSPERFLQKLENKIISQPIKGTRKRGKNNDVTNMCYK